MSVSLDYLSALVKWVAPTLMVQFFVITVQLFFIFKKNVNVKVIFATFYCKLISFNLYKYIFDIVDGG